MNIRVRRIINFLGTNLLVFALYLNFFNSGNQVLPGDFSMKTPAFGDSGRTKEPVRSHQEQSLELKEPAALAERNGTLMLKH